MSWRVNYRKRRRNSSPELRHERRDLRASGYQDHRRSMSCLVIEPLLPGIRSDYIPIQLLVLTSICLFSGSFFIPYLVSWSPHPRMPPSSCGILRLETTRGHWKVTQTVFRWANQGPMVVTNRDKMFASEKIFSEYSNHFHLVLKVAREGWLCNFSLVFWFSVDSHSPVGNDNRLRTRY